MQITSFAFKLLNISESYSSIAITKGVERYANPNPRHAELSKACLIHKVNNSFQHLLTSHHPTNLVVTKHLEVYGVYFGNPAIKVRERIINK